MASVDPTEARNVQIASSLPARLRHRKTLALIFR
jgi:hypothetical protein